MESEGKHPAPPRDAVFAYYPVEAPPQGDEIRLADLWLVLVRRKAVFFAVAGLILAAGLAYALLTPPKYRYSALIEIGLVPTAGGIEPVEAVSTALAKINEAFLPAVLADYLKTQPEGTSPPKIQASIPKDSETLTLTAEGPVDEGPTFMDLQAAVIARLAQDHVGFIDAERRSLRSNVTAAKDQLETLNTRTTLLESQAKRIDELTATLRKQGPETQRDLDEALTLEKQLLSANPSTRDTAALLQASVETRALRNQLLALDERLAVTLPRQTDDIGAAIEATAQEILAQQEHMANLEARLANVRETRATQPPTRSLEKAGVAKRVVVLLAGVLGVFLGMISAFGAELVANLRTEVAKAGTNPETARATD